ncbi:MAG: aminoglycoside phosphotransferase family protein [Chloroflexi bacterium]|nr:MAG: aminoglycoside phosphotransferase family protein [Chloroflexota bacterium]
MLEKPPIQDNRIIAQLRQAYGLNISEVEFLPLGADANTAVYRVVTGESAPYFLKLRKDNFEETSVLVPRFLYDQGIRQIIPPLKTLNGQLWSELEFYTCFLYPFIQGCSGFEAALSDTQWIEFGDALKRIHTTILPPEIEKQIPSATYSPRWREMVREFQAQVEHSNFEDPVAAKMAVFMRSHKEEISELVERAKVLGEVLQTQPLERVLCHSDIHGGNLLLTRSEDFYIVDWDNPILAPKERDLMFIGGGIGMNWNSEREEALFYKGYRSININLTALTYYRFERIVQDIAAFCELILLTTQGGEDREQGFQYFTSQFLPKNVIEIAHQTNRKLGEYIRSTTGK